MPRSICTTPLAQPASIAEVPVAPVPLQALGYIYPSRYCPSDRLLKLAGREFGQRKQGYSPVQYICDWVLQHTAFTQNTSDSDTSAIETMLSTVGVCRDFAHLMIALCRAVNIPARFATIFEPVIPSAPHITIEVLPDASGVLLMHWHCAEALSTDS